MSKIDHPEITKQEAHAFMKKAKKECLIAMSLLAAGILVFIRSIYLVIHSDGLVNILLNSGPPLVLSILLVLFSCNYILYANQSIKAHNLFMKEV